MHRRSSGRAARQDRRPQGPARQRRAHPRSRRRPKLREVERAVRRRTTHPDRDAVDGITNEDLIVEEDMVVTLSHLGYIKRNPVTLYRAAAPRRKGRARAWRRATRISSAIWASRPPTPTCSSSPTRAGCTGSRCTSCRSSAAPPRARRSSTCSQLADDEHIETMLPVRSFEDVGNDEYVILSTRNGIVKKTALTAYANPRKAGIIAINLSEGDELISAGRTSSQNEDPDRDAHRQGDPVRRDRCPADGPDGDGRARYRARPGR